MCAQTETPRLLFTPEIIYMMGNISNLVNVDWYLGAFFFPPRKVDAAS